MLVFLSLLNSVNLVHALLHTVGLHIVSMCCVLFLYVLVRYLGSYPALMCKRDVINLCE